MKILLYSGLRVGKGVRKVGGREGGRGKRKRVEIELDIELLSFYF